MSLYFQRKESPDLNSVGEITAHVSSLYSPLALLLLLFFLICFLIFLLRMCDFQQLIENFKALVNQINLSLIIGLISLS